MRSDQTIQENIIEELKWEPSVNATDIGVQVSEGVATLSGHVKSYAEKIHSEIATKRVKGVRAIAIELKVELPFEHHKSDAEIAKACLTALHWNINTSNQPIDVKVENGIVTISGDVDSPYQRESAKIALIHLLGVKGVFNQIKVNSKVDLTLLHNEIEDILIKQAKLNSKRVFVSTNEKTITLSGHVHSWSERQLILNVAWATPGVNDVIDELIFY